MKLVSLLLLMLTTDHNNTIQGSLKPFTNLPFRHFNISHLIFIHIFQDCQEYEKREKQACILFRNERMKEDIRILLKDKTKVSFSLIF